MKQHFAPARPSAAPDAGRPSALSTPGHSSAWPRALARLLTFALLVAVLGTTGCAVSSYTTAHPLPRGTSTFWVAPQAMRIAVGGAPQMMPFVELGTRYGLTDNVELGARLGAGLQVDAKIALLRPRAGRKLALSIAPGVGYIGNFSGTPTGSGGDDLHFAGATLPLLISYPIADGLDVTLGPRLGWLMQVVETSSAATSHTAAAGASLSVRWQISRAFAIVPELSFAAPWLRALTGTGVVAGTGGQRALQVGVGFVFGGATPTAASASPAAPPS